MTATIELIRYKDELGLRMKDDSSTVVMMLTEDQWEVLDNEYTKAMEDIYGERSNR